MRRLFYTFMSLLRRMRLLFNMEWWNKKTDHVPEVRHDLFFICL